MNKPIVIAKGLSFHHSPLNLLKSKINTTLKQTWEKQTLSEYNHHLITKTNHQHQTNPSKHIWSSHIIPFNETFKKSWIMKITKLQTLSTLLCKHVLKRITYLTQLLFGKWTPRNASLQKCFDSFFFLLLQLSLFKLSFSMIKPRTKWKDADGVYLSS